jgi:hypothetical protein
MSVIVFLLGLSIVLAIAPFIVVLVNRKLLDWVALLLLLVVSMFAISALYLPVKLLICWFENPQFGCYGDGWSELITWIWTSAVAVGIWITVGMLAASGGTKDSN